MLIKTLKLLTRFFSVILLLFVVYSFESNKEIETNYQKINHPKVNVYGMEAFTTNESIKQELEKRISDNSDISYSNVENEIKKSPFLDSVEIFVDVMKDVNIFYKEVQPIVRVFTSNKTSFYLDKNCKEIPISDFYYPDVLVASGYTESISNKGIISLCSLIQNNEFLRAQISQIHFDVKSEITFYTRIGNHILFLGDFGDLEKKIEKLMIFYEQIIPKHGWKKYKKIYLQYDKQIICKKHE